ncbi:glycosyltransferase [Dyella silvatica]|uniref:glycosyltransferase n=1 Tax=Dyella silvatica TaxID=2992128 RepID=UPI002253A752|nr:hypothetical protein [Dyella silvatica]
MIQVLSNLGDQIGAAYFCNADAEHYRKIVDNADVIVICRTRYDDHLNEMITRARAQGKRVLFDVDDLVFNTDYVHLVLKTLDQDLNHPGVWDHWFAYISRIGATLKLCDGAITTNKFLGDRITEFSGLQADVIPNFINKEQFEISDAIFHQKEASNFARNNEIHIGYFSGTPTHNHDFAIASEAIASVMKKFPEVRLLVVGFLELRGGLAEFSDRVTSLPLHDFINLQRIMSLVEINIVPLLDNGFTNCKSELKYFESAVVGSLTIATPTYTYANAIANESNGYLARSTEWAARLGDAITSLSDGRYRDMVVKARRDVSLQYSWAGQLEQIKHVLFGDVRGED